MCETFDICPLEIGLREDFKGNLISNYRLARSQTAFMIKSGGGNVHTPPPKRRYPTKGERVSFAHVGKRETLYCALQYMFIRSEGIRNARAPLSESRTVLRRVRRRPPLAEQKKIAPGPPFNRRNGRPKSVPLIA